MKLIKNYSKYYDSWLYVLRHPISCFKNWRLVKKYPFLLPYTVREGLDEKYHYQYTALDGMYAGWRKAFGKMMLDDIMKACKYDEINPKELCFVEIKEKWGMCRMTMNNTGHNLQEVLDAYEQVSGNVCWKCGKIDVPVTNFGWILPECRDCYMDNGRNSAQHYDDAVSKCSEDDCRIPDYYTVHRFGKDGSQYVNIDLTWITNRLRGVEK